MPYLSLLILLPFFEIVGFIVIGGAIGLAWSLLWLLMAGVAGLYILSHIGIEPRPNRRKKTVDDSDFGALEKIFDEVCRLLCGFLLVFPGFISDFIALLLLIPQLRHLIFGLLIRSNKQVLHDLGKSAEDLSMWYAGQESEAQIIEGDWTRTDDKK